MVSDFFYSLLPNNILEQTEAAGIISQYELQLDRGVERFYEDTDKTRSHTQHSHSSTRLVQTMRQ